MAGHCQRQDGNPRPDSQFRVALVSVAISAIIRGLDSAPSWCSGTSSQLCPSDQHTSEFMWLDLLVVNPLACPPALHCVPQSFWKVSFTWQILPQLLGQWLREKMQEACIVYEELKQVIFSYFKEPCAGLAAPQICTQIRYHETAEYQRRETVTEEKPPLWELQPEWQQVSTETNRSYKAKKTSKCREKIMIKTSKCQEKIMINWGFYTW